MRVSTQWRYAIGEDREALNKVDRKITEEEAKKMAQVHVIDGVKRVVEKILGRRKLKSSYEYEVRSGLSRISPATHARIEGHLLARLAACLPPHSSFPE
jgi:elongation factor 3